MENNNHPFSPGVELKYVMLDRLAPVVFFSSIEHRRLRALGNITSAGFVRFLPCRDGGLSVKTYGYSHSLGMGPHPADAEIITLFINKSTEVKG